AVVGLVVGFAGVGILVAPGGAGHTHLPAALALVGSSFCWAAGSLYSRRAPLPKRPLIGASMQMLVGGLLLGIAGLARGEAGQVNLSQVSPESLGGLFYLVLVGSLVGFTCYVWLLRNAPTSLVGTYAYVNPVVAVLLGLLFLSESLSWRTV